MSSDGAQAKSYSASNLNIIKKIDPNQEIESPGLIDKNADNRKIMKRIDNDDEISSEEADSEYLREK